MSSLEAALLYGLLAGAAIPVGGLLGLVESIRPQWRHGELRHSVIAFGGGVLIAAVALVLVPEGSALVPSVFVLPIFGAGGLAFFAIDRTLQMHGTSVAQLLAMLIDFVPESLALGVALATGGDAGPLLALLIAFQNLPEGFNAYRETRAAMRLRPGAIIALFAAMACLGPIMAWVGFTFLRAHTEISGAVMLFAAGGILYLTFQDIAPQARLQRHWAPPLGAVAGFMVGLLGDIML